MSYEMVQNPNLENLRPWGCTSNVHNTSHRYGKLGPKANKNVFIRYSDYSKGYVMYGEHLNKGVDAHFSHVFPLDGETRFLFVKF